MTTALIMESEILCFQGQCLSLKLSSKGRLKSLELQLKDGSIWLDIPKYLGYSLHDRLQKGVDLQAWVRPQNARGLQFKALMIVLGQPLTGSPLTRLKSINSDTTIAPDIATDLALNTLSPAIQTIRVCTKGSCRKKGSLQLLQQLENQTQQQGLNDRIKVQAIGCLKQCKTAPNIQLPHGQTLDSVNPLDIDSILSRCQISCRF